MSYTQSKKVWGMPLLLAVLTVFGLLSSLLGTGYWYWLSWAALIIPLAIILLKVRPLKK